MEDIKKQILKLCHDFKVDCLYWDHNRLKEISEYCERDVDVLIDAIMKLKTLQ